MLLKKVDKLLGPMLARIFQYRQGKGPLPPVVSSILLIRPGGIGDAVHLLPTIQAIKAANPSVKIDILAEKRNAAVFSLCSDVGQVFLYDRPTEFLTVLRRRYDVIIDTEQWHHLSALVARLIRSHCKIGFASNERRRMFTHCVDYSHDDYEMESFSHLLTPLDLPFTIDLNHPFLHVPSVARHRAHELLAGYDGPFVTLFPGASIPERRWGVDRFRELARRLMQNGLRLVVVGGAEDREAGEEIVKDGGLNLAGSTALIETAAILEKSTLLVSGDSGVLHLAVGLGTPTVSLFGPGIAAKWAPRGAQHRVLNLGLACSPCTRFGTTPPCSVTSRCIEEIEVEEVFQQAMTLIQQRSAENFGC